jgi:hypothetical protein
VVQLDILTGNNELSFTDDDVTVYPNPFSDKLSIEYYLTGKARVEINIYNSFGEKAFETTGTGTGTGTHTETISVSNLAKGIYFIILKADGAIIQTEKIIK